MEDGVGAERRTSEVSERVLWVREVLDLALPLQCSFPTLLYKERTAKPRTNGTPQNDGSATCNAMTSMGRKRDKFTALAAKNTNPDQREMHETLRLPRKTYLFGNAANGSGRYDEIGEESSTPRLPTTNGTPTQGPMLTNS